MRRIADNSLAVVELDRANALASERRVAWRHRKFNAEGRSRLRGRFGREAWRIARVVTRGSFGEPIAHFEARDRKTGLVAQVLSSVFSSDEALGRDIHNRGHLFACQ